MKNLGVYRSGKNAPEQVSLYEQWLGRPITHAVDFVGRGDTWTIDNPAWLAKRWATNPWTPVITAAMVPNADYALVDGALGAFNNHWQKFGTQLVKNGCADAILRIGHEFNGRFYPWKAEGKEKHFVAYWREIVKTLRKVPGQKFLFDWCPLAGVTSVNVEAAYPGDDYVDIIGLDAYDTALPKYLGKPTERWQYQLDRPYGLVWHATFAAKHNKPMSFPEWGLTFRPKDKIGGGDNPHYITKMWDWFKTHDIAYAAYFEDDTPSNSHRLMTDQFPKSSAEYQKLVKQG